MTDNTDFPSLALSRPMSAETRGGLNDDAATVVKARPKPTCAAPIRGEPTSTPIAKAQQAVIDALDRFESDWRDIADAEQRGELTPEGRAAAVADATPTDAIDQALAMVAARAEKADNDYKAARAALSPQTTTELDALSHDMFWRRTSRELDSVPAGRVAASTQRLIETAAGRELSWLSTELPSYLRSRNVNDGWVNSALEQASPKLKAASETRRKAEQSHAIVSANARIAKRAMASALEGSYRRPIGLVGVSAFDPDA